MRDFKNTDFCIGMFKFMILKDAIKLNCRHVIFKNLITIEDMLFIIFDLLNFVNSPVLRNNKLHKMTTWYIFVYLF